MVDLEAVVLHLGPFRTAELDLPDDIADPLQVVLLKRRDHVHEHEVRLQFPVAVVKDSCLVHQEVKLLCSRR